MDERLSNGSHGSGGIERITELVLLHKLDGAIDKLLIQGLVHVDALYQCQRS